MEIFDEKQWKYAQSEKWTLNELLLLLLICVIVRPNIYNLTTAFFTVTVAHKVAHSTHQEMHLFVGTLSSCTPYENVLI